MTLRRGCGVRNRRCTRWPAARSSLCGRPQCISFGGQPRSNSSSPGPSALASGSPRILSAVGTVLDAASDQFMADLDAFAPARDVYEKNTRIAARRVHELIADGVASGDFRDVHAAFAADLATTMMVRIQQRLGSGGHRFRRCPAPTGSWPRFSPLGSTPESSLATRAARLLETCRARLTYGDSIRVVARTLVCSWPALAPSCRSPCACANVLLPRRLCPLRPSC